ncbi:threonine synthase-like 2 [Mercenaria mercenaria]|uniref:threonine synthase-like 2 n=1 Tax=Mercenaria mercenaria TaxID=6596 RepID=UPI00234F51DB|nr:threonine synthase-like 2 [Mercenaria mercenaria]
MKYGSTRGGVRDLTFEEALFTGYACDGGILLPQQIPSVPIETLKSWKDLSFVELAKKIVPYFISEEEIPAPDLNELLDKAYGTFSCPEIAPVASLKDDVTILELFHGKTWAFKDLALSCVGQFINYFCSRSKTHYTVIVGTSGDTGSAAIEAVRGLKWVDIIVLLPRGRTSYVQEKQMTTATDKNVHVFRVDGTSDDLDLIIKPVFLDEDFQKKYHLTSINSINWSRIMVQIVHYFYAYLKMCDDCGRPVEIAVPTGACGNVTSGCIAAKMGLPIRLVCAVTCNDIVSRTIASGDFSMAPDVTPTLAPAMDIQIPYNMERIWYIFSEGDTALVSGLMAQFEKNGSVKVPDELAKKISSVIVDTFVATDDDVKATMLKIWKDNSYQICPHTSTAVAYHLGQRKKNDMKTPRICIATASVAKFQEAVKAAGVPVQQDERVTALQNMDTKYEDMEKGEDWEKLLRKKIVEINA